MMKDVKIAVIGGSGLSQIDGLKVIESVAVDTPYGKTSDEILIAELEGRRIAFLPRHGRMHNIPPTHVPYRANIWALKKLGVFWCVTLSAVGSLQAEIKPEHFAVPDQIIDRTKFRKSSFFDDLVVHISFADPFNSVLRQILIDACKAEKIPTHETACYLCMEGPAFSTRAESQLYRSWGADIIGMTAIPEAKLALEAEMAYATIAQATDYDCWHQSVVTVEEVVAHMQNNVHNVQRVLKRLLPMIPLGTEDENPASRALQPALITRKEAITPDLREKYELLLHKYYDF
ncbi:MAG: S-methyl-5'-thioadenosine phosphorylase [Bradymonadales bacterium]